MDLKSLITVSERIFLADVSPAFAALEGEVAPDDRVWIKARQATEEDFRRRATIYEKRDVRYDSDAEGKIASITESVKDNPYVQRAFEVWRTLQDVGNLTNDGKVVFKKLPAWELPESEFNVLFGTLHPALARAIHDAILKMNPSWKSGLGGQ